MGAAMGRAPGAVRPALARRRASTGAPRTPPRRPPPGRRRARARGARVGDDAAAPGQPAVARVGTAYDDGQPDQQHGDAPEGGEPASAEAAHRPAPRVRHGEGRAASSAPAPGRRRQDGGHDTEGPVGRLPGGRRCTDGSGGATLEGASRRAGVVGGRLPSPPPAVRWTGASAAGTVDGARRSGLPRPTPSYIASNGWPAVAIVAQPLYVRRSTLHIGNGW